MATIITHATRSLSSHPCVTLPAVSFFLQCLPAAAGHISLAGGPFVVGLHAQKFVVGLQPKQPKSS
jgi:hypothetical protein